MEDAHHGYAESRREQVRLQEELVWKEKAFRDTQIRSMYEMGEMKRAQELRVEEFSVQKINRKFETIQRLTSQMKDMQGQMNSMNDSGENDSGEFQEVNQITVGDCLMFPVNQQRFQVIVLC